MINKKEEFCPVGLTNRVPLFYTEQNDKPGYVVDDHLSSLPVTRQLKRPTRKQTGRLMLPIRSCFEWGLHVPSLLPARR